MQNHTAALAILTITCAAAAGCFDSMNKYGDGDGDGQGASSSTQVGGAGSEGGNGAGNSSNVANDVPCDVAKVLADSCVKCHGDVDPKGAVALTSYAALSAPSPVDATQTVAQRSVIRMRSASSPMPQTGLLPEADIQVVEAWVTAGAPKGDCGEVIEPTPIEVVCTSGNFWSQGCHESKDMKPGAACVSCHQNPTNECGDEDNGPHLSFGGTAYPTPNEPDDCVAVGVDGATVVVTDANGVAHTASVRAGGNFYIEGPALALPITAEIRRNGNVIKMKDPVDSVDCNTCHTALGKEGAAGRVFPPQ